MSRRDDDDLNHNHNHNHNHKNNNNNNNNNNNSPDESNPTTTTTKATTTIMKTPHRKLFVITGGARGIGRALVDYFLKAHHCVSTCDILPFVETTTITTTTTTTRTTQRPSPEKGGQPSSTATATATATPQSTSPPKPTALYDPANFYFEPCNISNELQVQRFVQHTLNHFDTTSIHCVIHNAAISNPYLSYETSISELDMAEFQNYLQVNLVGPMMVTKHCIAALQTMPETINQDDKAQSKQSLSQSSQSHSSSASIIHITSTRAQMSEPKSEGYAASKGGLESLTHALAISLQQELQQQQQQQQFKQSSQQSKQSSQQSKQQSHRQRQSRRRRRLVRVNAVAPGWIHTPEQEQTVTPSVDDHAFHPVGRVGTVHDICHVCDFLSDATKSGFITGQTFTVDGGVTHKMMYPEDDHDHDHENDDEPEEHENEPDDEQDEPDEHGKEPDEPKDRKE